MYAKLLTFVCHISNNHIDGCRLPDAKHSCRYQGADSHLTPLRYIARPLKDQNVNVGKHGDLCVAYLLVANLETAGSKICYILCNF